jgi:hypothetical protein
LFKKKKGTELQKFWIIQEKNFCQYKGRRTGTHSITYFLD